MTDPGPLEAVTFTVALAESRSGPSCRIVVYDWFCRGEGWTPPRGGNRVEVLVDGEQGWGRVADDLEAAEREIQIATWMCRPDIELRRPRALAVAEREQRAHFRLGELLEARAAAGAQIRLLIWGMAYTPIVDRWLRRWYWRGRDNIDVLEQDHPHLLGSRHQKMITIDGRVGYCGGMNLKENDWDTTAHDTHDARRHPHRAQVERRRQTAARMEAPAFAPRHDLILRIEGPVVGDLHDNFASRWTRSVEARRASWLGRMVDRLRRALGNSDYPRVEPGEVVPAAAGTHWVQVVRTVPGSEAGILGAYTRAIRNARRYIYIENQYFRSPTIGRELRDAVAANPRLRLVVVVRPVNGGHKSLFDPSGYWTAHTLQLIREARPHFELSELVPWGRDVDDRLVWQSLDVHAKAMVIDDVWLTVGSANINDRSFKTDGEINTVVLDKALATDLRRRLMAEHLEIPMEDERLDDVDEAFDLWEEHGRLNPRRRQLGEEPLSRVHHFVQEGLGRPPFGVGSGIF